MIGEAEEIGQFATRVVQELSAIARFWGHSLRTISLPMFTNLPEEVAWHQPLDALTKICVWSLLMKWLISNAATIGSDGSNGSL